eukprot:GEMP01017341.1.p1 GENE.GEMP01017341.1~~GEMP01017341.1.p1  ORF type:complete len:621 (+),score=66.55 GEMP01017341.1:164-1864(+)
MYIYSFCMRFILSSYFLRAVSAVDLSVSRTFIDAHNRTLTFHGVNVVRKSAPWLPISTHFDPYTSFSVEDARFLRSAGINAIRLGVMWPGVEPTRGRYSDTYLKNIRIIVDICKQHDIKVLFDAHQDVFSPRFCGEGLPNWAAPLASSQSSWFPFPRGSWTWPRYDYNSTTGDEEDALPIAEQCASRMWAHYYLACAVGYAFDVLYTDKGYSGGWFHGWCHGSGDKRENGLRTQFANFWALLAQEFKNDDAVLGFEILNEPWIGNWYNHPSFIIDFGNAEKSRLQPFYDIITNAIHKEDPRRIVFYEPTTFSDRTVSIYIPFYGPISIGVWGKMGLTRPKDTNIVTVNGTIVTHPASFAYHYYAAVNPHMNKYLDTREEDAQRMDTPAIVTEFWTGGEDALPAMRHFEHDATTWFVWTYKSFRDNISASGNTDLSRVSETQPECHGEGPLWSANGILASCTRNIARPYSMALQGTLVSQYFNETSVIYTLTYRANPSDKSAATEIFVNTQVPDVPEKYKDAASRAYVPYFVYFTPTLLWTSKLCTDVRCRRSLTIKWPASGQVHEN